MWRDSYAYRRFFRALVYLIDDGYFICYWLCWFLIRFTRSSDYPIPYLNNWLTDFVFVPIIVHSAQAVGIYIFDRKKPYTFPLAQIVLISLLASLVFELLMPTITVHHTADPWDTVAYLAGGIFYYLIHQRVSIKKYNAY